TTGAPAVQSRTAFEPSGLVLSFRNLTPRYKRMVATFAAANDAPLTPPSVDPLVIRVSRGFRQSGRATDPPYSEMQFRWTMPSGSGSYFVYLPHGYPDDRRSRVRITAP